MRVVRVGTVPFFFLHHLEGQLRALVEAGHEVHVVTSPVEGFEKIRALGVASVVPLQIPRQISPLADLRALAGLVDVLRRLRPDVVDSGTPKAGLLAAIAGRLCGVPVRLHTFTGQAWAERRGLVRWLARAADRLIVRLNTRCYADSASQRDFLVAEGLAAPGAIHVLGAGSITGVDVARFDAARLRDEGLRVRAALGIPADRKVVVFVGRVTRDKGIAELVEAFENIHGAHLVIVGPLEPERDPLPAATLDALRRNPAIHAVGYDPAPERYLAFANLFCLPSYREGFGNVVIEAAAMGVPCVGTRIVGLTDAIVDGETGVLVPPKDAAALRAALAALLADDERRLRLGQAARARAIAEFDATVVQRRVVEAYRRLAAGMGSQIGA